MTFLNSKGEAIDDVHNLVLSSLTIAIIPLYLFADWFQSNWFYFLKIYVYIFFKGLQFLWFGMAIIVQAYVTKHCSCLTIECCKIFVLYLGNYRKCYKQSLMLFWFTLFPLISEDFNVIDSKYIKKSAIHMIPVFNFYVCMLFAYMIW